MYNAVQIIFIAHKISECLIKGDKSFIFPVHCKVILKTVISIALICFFKHWETNFYKTIFHYILQDVQNS